MSRLVSLIRRLRWRLTLSYTIVTVAALLVVELALMMGGGAYFVARAGLTPRQLVEDVQENLVPAVRTNFFEAPLNIQDEVFWLKKLSAMGDNPSSFSVLGTLHLNMRIERSLDFYVLDTKGRVLDTLPTDLVPEEQIGNRLLEATVPGLAEPLAAALAGEQSFRKLYTIHRPDRKLVAAVPVMDNIGEHVLGAIVFTSEAVPWTLWSMGDVAQQFGYSLIFFVLFAGALGTLFGSLTAKSLVGRLQRLSSCAHSWSRGDFSVFVEDPNLDELGALARDLNQMAQRLEDLLDQRQEMSVLAERNRLARDLHDSAKQQAFAASAQLGAARALFGQDPAAARRHLGEAETLVDAVRQELTHLIQELRPVALNEAGLPGALRDYAVEWAKQSNMLIDVQIRNERPLPVEIERSLYRIAQEALANASRHSKAKKVELELTYRSDSVILRIADDGCGFDVNWLKPGLGLQSMRERAALLNGRLTIESCPGGGTCLTLVCRC